MFEDDMTVPSGWYPDPMGLPQLRWWNNHAWTELTTEARPPLVMQTPTRLSYADEELPTRRQQREQRERDEQYATPATDDDEAREATAAPAPPAVTLREIDAPAAALSSSEIDSAAIDSTVIDSTEIDSTAIHGPDDFDDDAVDAGDPALGGTNSSTASTRIVDLDSVIDSDSPVWGRSLSRLPIYTAPIWIIALVPLVLLVVSLLLLLGFGSSLNMWVTPAIWVVSYFVVVALAIADRVALGRAGYEHRASWAWAFLTAPAYLLARSMSLARVGSLGFAPVLVWVALGILQAGSVLVVPGLIISALPEVFAAQAEHAVASNASIIGADISVDCSKALPVIIGQTFECTATRATDSPFTVIVSLERTNGWIDWHVDDWGVFTLSR